MGSKLAPPPHLSFWYTNFMKCSRIRSWLPRLGSAPHPQREILDPPLHTFRHCRHLFYCYLHSQQCYDEGISPRLQQFLRIVLDLEFDDTIEWNSTRCCKQHYSLHIILWKQKHLSGNMPLSIGLLFTFFFTSFLPFVVLPWNPILVSVTIREWPSI